LTANGTGAGIDDARVHECPRCGGIFVPPEALAEILTRAEVVGGFSPRPSPSALGAVTYVSCPLCHKTMNRVNFGKVSGVIVDVCRQHGSWFDGGELTRVVAFAASGRLAQVGAQARKDAVLEARLETWRDFLRSLF
jgi:Zn-finger nucleic acid-binding protein